MSGSVTFMTVFLLEEFRLVFTEFTEVILSPRATLPIIAVTNLSHFILSHLKLRQYFCQVYSHFPRAFVYFQFTKISFFTCIISFSTIAEFLTANSNISTAPSWNSSQRAHHISKHSNICSTSNIIAFTNMPPTKVQGGGLAFSLQFPT